MPARDLRISIAEARHSMSTRDAPSIRSTTEFGTGLGLRMRLRAQEWSFHDHLLAPEKPNGSAATCRLAVTRNVA
jgi:hypothetical protein